MSILNTSDWFAKKKKFKPQEVDVEGVDFLLIPLTDELIEQAKSCTTYAEMLMSAADFGQAADFGNKSGPTRVYDDIESRDDIEMLWHQELLAAIDCEPSLQQKVGEKVCAISGMTSYYEERKRKEDNDTAELARMEADEKKAEAKAREDFEVIPGESKEDESIRFVAKMEADALEENGILTVDADKGIDLDEVAAANAAYKLTA